MAAFLARQHDRLSAQLAMAFLSELLERPANEKAFLVMPVGYPAEGAKVPALSRKPLEEIAVWR